MRPEAAWSPSSALSVVGLVGALAAMATVASVCTSASSGPEAVAELPVPGPSSTPPSGRAVGTDADGSHSGSSPERSDGLEPAAAADRPLLNAEQGPDSGASRIAVADTLCAVPGDWGPGCWALNEAYDSVLWGGDRLRVSGDEWPVRVWKITTCPGPGDERGGPGTFAAARDSVVRHQPRALQIIVAAVSGVCRDTTFTEQPLQNTVIAMQTAPGQGVSWWGGSWQLRSTRSGHHRPRDVVISHLRAVRLGDGGINVTSGSRILLRHTSSRWSGGGGGQYNTRMGADSTRNRRRYEPAQNLEDVTVLRPLVLEPRIDHPTQLGLDCLPRNRPACRRMMLVGALFAGRGHRTPAVQADTVGVYGTVSVNWTIRGPEHGSQAIAHFAGNWWIAGPATRRSIPYWAGAGCEAPLAGDRPGACVQRIALEKNTLWTPTDTLDRRSVHATDPDSMVVGSRRMVACRQLRSAPGGRVDPPWRCPADGDTAARAVFDAEPLAARDFGIPERWFPARHADWMTREALLATVDSAGPAFLLACDGRWRAADDSIDADVKGRVRNHLGGRSPGLRAGWVDDAGPHTVVRDAVDARGQPGPARDTVDWVRQGVPEGGRPCPDTDGDGMFDAAEARLGTDPRRADGHLDPDGDGYPSVVEFLFGFPPRVFTDDRGRD